MFKFFLISNYSNSMLLLNIFVLLHKKGRFIITCKENKKKELLVSSARDQVSLKCRDHPRVLYAVLFQLLYCSILLYFWNFEYHARALKNLTKLSLLFKVIFYLLADAYLVNATACFYSFWNMQKVELLCCNYVHSPL